MTATMTARKPRRAKPAAPATLALRLGGSYYSVSRVDPGESGVIAWRLAKASAEADPYDVRLSLDGSISCTCADWNFRHDGNGTACKHIASIVAVGLMRGPSPVVEVVEAPAVVVDAAPAVEVAQVADPIPADAWGWARWITRRWDLATEGQRMAAVVVLDGHQSTWAKFPAPADGELVASPLPVREPAPVVRANLPEPAEVNLEANLPQGSEVVGLNPRANWPEGISDPETLAACCPADEPVPCAACHPIPVASYFGVGVVDPPADDVQDDAPCFADELLDAIEAHGGPIVQGEPETATDAEPPVEPGGPYDALPLVLAIRRDADVYRARGTSLGDLYAETRDRVADTADRVEATRAADVFDRHDALEDLRVNEMVVRAYDRGYAAADRGEPAAEF